jgi:hypothetical protein
MLGYVRFPGLAELLNSQPLIVCLSVCLSFLPVCLLLPAQSIQLELIMPDFKEIAKHGWHPDKVCVSTLVPSESPAALEGFQD